MTFKCQPHIITCVFLEEMVSLNKFMNFEILQVLTWYQYYLQYFIYISGGAKLYYGHIICYEGECVNL